jgi:hypothetical protein
MAAASVAEVLSSAHDLLAAHSALIQRVQTSQQLHRRQLRAIPSPPSPIAELANLPIVPLPHSPPPRSPSSSRSSSPISWGAPDLRNVNRPDLPPAKRARVLRYRNYVPEEETIRNDYSQRYVDGGEWPQNWVLGAEPEHRFEECVLPI